MGGALVEHLDRGIDSVEHGGGEIIGLLGSRYMEGALIDLLDVTNEWITDDCCLKASERRRSVPALGDFFLTMFITCAFSVELVL